MRTKFNISHDIIFNYKQFFINIDLLNLFYFYKKSLMKNIYQNN